MACSKRPVRLTIMTTAIPNGYTDVRWDITHRFHPDGRYVVAEPIPEGYLIGSWRAECMIAVSTWRQKLYEWDSLHPELLTSD